jgi:hypothetical protein
MENGGAWCFDARASESDVIRINGLLKNGIFLYIESAVVCSVFPSFTHEATLSGFIVSTLLLIIVNKLLLSYIS